MLKIEYRNFFRRPRLPSAPPSDSFRVTSEHSNTLPGRGKTNKSIHVVNNTGARQSFGKRWQVGELKCDQKCQGMYGKKCMFLTTSRQNVLLSVAEFHDLATKIFLFSFFR